jgi:Schlafen group 3, DNA/RNA helicase domain
MNRSFYSETITNFQNNSIEEIIGRISLGNEFGLEQTQRDAWFEEITILKNNLQSYNGKIYFEYSIPRLGQRIDVLLIIKSVIFVLEFKVGERKYSSYAIDQVTDYALDLKNFHETSHDKFIVPILIATQSKETFSLLNLTPQRDRILVPIKANPKILNDVIEKVLLFLEGDNINIYEWELGHYQPTPTIVEAAMALYNHHSVEEITRSDASAINLSQTSDTISEIISISKNNSRKSICFVTGVPGAGKTLVGLNIATKHINKSNDLYSVFLSGNGPLVAILREALTRDKVLREKSNGNKITKGEVLSEVKMFIQNVHNFRMNILMIKVHH